MNLLKTQYPNIFIEINIEKNKLIGISVDQINKLTVGSNKKIWWTCSKGHSYFTKVYNRTGKNKTGCPYCSRQKVLKNFNDFASNCPTLLKEWDFNKNIIKPDEIVAGSTKKVWWICSYRHSYQTSIISRAKLHTNCPYCTNKKVLKGFNDLQTKFPDIVKEWDYEKNIIKPDEITPGSYKKVYWKCSLNHSWKAIIANRTHRKDNCPYCSNKKLLPKFNDLLTKNPQLAKEYDNIKNKLKANEISYGSAKKVWWKCSKGHSWQETINNRIYKLTKCPFCSFHGTSAHELLLLNALAKLYICEHRKKHKINNKSWETDIYLPELNIGIEFNGLYWHKIKKDRSKYDNLKEQTLSSKMKVFYIYEASKNYIYKNKIYFNIKYEYEENFLWAKNKLIEIIKKEEMENK